MKTCQREKEMPFGYGLFWVICLVFFKCHHQCTGNYIAHAAPYRETIMAWSWKERLRHAGFYHFLKNVLVGDWFIFHPQSHIAIKSFFCLPGSSVLGVGNEICKDSFYRAASPNVLCKIWLNTSVGKLGKVPTVIFIGVSKTKTFG